MSAVFSLAVEQDVNVTPPGRRVTPTEAVFGFTGNVGCHAVASPSIAGCGGSVDVTLTAFKASSAGRSLVGHFPQKRRNAV